MKELKKQEPQKYGMEGGRPMFPKAYPIASGKKPPFLRVWLMMESEEISKTNFVRQELIQLISLGSVQTLKVLFQRMQKGH